MDEAVLFFSNIKKQFEMKKKSFREKKTDNTNLLKIIPEIKRQKIQGFGSSFTEGAGYIYSQMSETSKEKVLELCFSENGNRYNMARLPIQSCDFSLGNYAYVQNEKELKKKNFDFSHDDKYIIPFVKAAIEKNPTITFMASPWSPPAFMKSNKDMNKGGYLLKEYYEAWADVILAYLDHYIKHGIKIKKFSVQNEPVAAKEWDSCLYTNSNELFFAVDVLQKKLAGTSHADIELYVWDHDKDGLIEWASQSFSENKGYKKIAGLAFHWYTGDHFEQLAYLSETYPDKDLLFTEGCVPQEGYSAAVQREHAKVYIHELINNFRFGTSGYIDWNILLDNNGGPNHMNNTCEAPIQYNTQKDLLQINLSYYFIGHLSRFVTVGSHVIFSSVYDSKLDHVCFLTADQRKVLVVYNNDLKAKTFRVSEKKSELEVELAAGEVVTILWS